MSSDERLFIIKLMKLIFISKQISTNETSTGVAYQLIFLVRFNKVRSYSGNN